MPETVKLPGMGPVKKQYVYAGGALIVGIVGFAYWRRASAGADTVGAADLGVEGVDDGYAWPFRPGGSVVESAPVDPETMPPTTNAEWAMRAVRRLVDNGYDPLKVTMVLGKYVAGLTLTSAEAEIVRAAIALVGPLPKGPGFVRTEGDPTSPGSALLTIPVIEPPHSQPGNQSTLPWGQGSSQQFWDLAGRSVRFAEEGNRNSLKQQLDHLIALGHRSIAYMLSELGEYNPDEASFIANDVIHGNVAAWDAQNRLMQISRQNPDLASLRDALERSLRENPMGESTPTLPVR